jgi:hypothetical protein
LYVLVNEHHVLEEIVIGLVMRGRGGGRMWEYVE